LRRPPTTPDRRCRTSAVTPRRPTSGSSRSSTCGELEGRAQKVIPNGGSGYIVSAAGDEWTKHENEAAYKRVTIVPHYLSGLDSADTTTTLLGNKLSMPIIVSVMGGHGLAHASAEAGSARGAAAAGTLMIAPSQSNVTLEDTMKAGNNPKFFQIYIPQDRGVARDVLLRAKAAGYKAITVTIDATVSSNRETDTRNKFHSPLPNANFPGTAVATAARRSKKPRLGRYRLRARNHRNAGVHQGRALAGPRDGGDQTRPSRAFKFQPRRPSTRRHAASFTVLRRLPKAVGGRIPIIVDGGIRRVRTSSKALAMGRERRRARPSGALRAIARRLDGRARNARAPQRRIEDDDASGRSEVDCRHFQRIFERVRMSIVRLVAATAAAIVLFSGVRPRPLRPPPRSRAAALVVFGTCNDCHTAGWREADGNVRLRAG